jgi:putative RNA 2'-phosphotransferase
METTLAIKKKGILKMSRQHVHLSEQLQTAFDVGSRHGSPAVFTIDSKVMLADGIDFYKSENGVWLVDHVEPKYLKDVIYKNSVR